MTKLPNKRTKGGIEIRGDSISYRYYIKDPTHPKGRREVRRSGFATIREAEKDQREQLSLRDKGISVLPNNLTVADYFPKCLESHFKTEGLRPQSRDDYVLHLKTYILPKLGTLKLVECSSLLLENFLLELRSGGSSRKGKPLSSSTVEKVGIILKIGFKNAVRQKILALNPMTDIKTPRRKSERVPEIDPQTLNKLKQVWNEERLGIVFEVLLNLGARMGEVLCLRWNDIDLVKGEVTISKTIYISNRVTYENAPKSSNGFRTVSLTEGQIRGLREWRIRQAEERLKAGSLWKEGDFVFTNQIGEPIKSYDLRTVWNRIQRAIGEKGIHLHSLRHTHISTLLRGGVPAHTVAKRVGDTVATILRVYAHSNPQDDKQASEIFERMIRKA